MSVIKIILLLLFLTLFITVALKAQVNYVWEVDDGEKVNEIIKGLVSKDMYEAEVDDPVYYVQRGGDYDKSRSEILDILKQLNNAFTN